MRQITQEIYRKPIKSSRPLNTPTACKPIQEEEYSEAPSINKQSHSNSFSAQNETTLHSKAARYFRINPIFYPYGRMQTGKTELKHDEDPWIQLRPLTTEANLLLEQKQITPISSNKSSKPTSKEISRRLNKSLQENTNHLSEAGNSKQKTEKIIITESALYKQIYFAKIEFPHFMNSIDMSQSTAQVAFQVVARIFKEISLSLFNTLVCSSQNSTTFSVFFQDSSEVPFSKCCNSPVRVDLIENGAGVIMCNSTECKANILEQFLISFEEAGKLWKDKVVFRIAKNKDSEMRAKISLLISNGKYRFSSLERQIDRTSRDISKIFIESQQQQRQNSQQSQKQPQKKSKSSTARNQEQTDSLFITRKLINELNEENQNQDTINTIIEEKVYKKLSEGSHVSQYNQLLSEGLVQNSEVFSKNFYQFLTNNKTFCPPLSNSNKRKVDKKISDRKKDSHLNYKWKSPTDLEASSQQSSQKQ